MGCEVISIHCDGSGQFNRGTEPLPGNLHDLCTQVIDSNADVGFAVDPDADRLAIVNNQGKPIGEEYTLVLAAEGYLNESGEPQNIVTNLSTTTSI